MYTLIGLAALSLATASSLTAADRLPVRLEVKTDLNSRLANIHLSQHHQTLYPFTVKYGACHVSNDHREQHHTISEVQEQSTQRLVWLLPDNIYDGGCLSAWSSDEELIGRSEPLRINKNSRQWMRKRSLDQKTRLNKRASIPMNNASGIDAEGPWFDGVELLQEKEIATVDVTQAKAKRNLPSDTSVL